MPKKPKSKKRPQWTWYAYQLKRTGRWWKEQDEGSDYTAESVQDATLFSARADIDEEEVFVQPFRCRPLTSRKRNPKRNR